MGFFNLFKKREEITHYSDEHIWKDIASFKAYRKTLCTYYETMSLSQLNKNYLSQLSLTDCAHLIVYFAWKCNQEGSQLDFCRKMILLLQEIAYDKFLTLDNCYCLYDFKTEEPKIFTEKVNDKIYAYIHVYTPSYYALHYENQKEKNSFYDKIEKRRNGVFIHHVCHMIGIDKIYINDSILYLDGKRLDQLNDKKFNIQNSSTHINPELKKYLIYFNQLQQDSEVEKQYLDDVYYKIFFVLLEANLLLPVFPNEEQVRIPMLENAQQQKAMPAYTDLEKLREQFEGFQYIVKKIDTIIELENDIVLEGLFYIGDDEKALIKKLIEYKANT